MEPINFIMFVVLISFAALAVIMDKSGFVMRDEEGNESPVMVHYLWQGSGIALMCGWAVYIVHWVTLAGR
jgi:hypothetical protein